MRDHSAVDWAPSLRAPGACLIGLSRRACAWPKTKVALGIDPDFVPVFTVALVHPVVAPSPPGGRVPLVRYIQAS